MQRMDASGAGGRDGRAAVVTRGRGGGALWQEPSRMALEGRVRLGPWEATGQGKVIGIVIVQGTS